MTILYGFLRYYFWAYVQTPLFYAVLTYFSSQLLEAFFFKGSLQKRPQCIACLKFVRLAHKQCKTCDDVGLPALKKKFLQEQGRKFRWLFVVAGGLLLASYTLLAEMWLMRWSRYDAYGMLIATGYFFWIARPLAYYLIFGFQQPEKKASLG